MSGVKTRVWKRVKYAGPGQPAIKTALQAIPVEPALLAAAAYDMPPKPRQPFPE
jgi:hypothetical protein